MPDSDGVHEGSGFSGSASAQRFELDDGTEAVQCGEAIHEEATEHRIVSTPVDPDDEQALPHAPSTGVFAKDYEDCSADQRDERWRDGAESLAAWTTKQLEAKGAAPLEARVEAEAAAQGTITKARAASTRADGLT